MLSGKLDPIAPHAANVALARSISTARHHVWTEASHALPIQLPDAVNARLLAHLEAQALRKGSGELASSNRRDGQ